MFTFDAHHMNLYRVDLLGSLLEGMMVESRTMLRATTRLADIYPDGPPENTVHFLAQLPEVGELLPIGINRMTKLINYSPAGYSRLEPVQPTIYRIWCTIAGTDSLFSIKISRKKTVDELKNAIKEKLSNRFANIPAHYMGLYRIDVPFPLPDGLVADPLKKLRATTELVKIYPDGPPEETVHILVQPPDGARGMKRKRDELEEATQERRILKTFRRGVPSGLAAPSAFQIISKDVVCGNRPFKWNTFPIDLLQSEFGEFKGDCLKRLTIWAQELLRDLTVALCTRHENVYHRREAIYEALRDAGIDLPRGGVPDTEYKPDGVANVNIMPAVISVCNSDSVNAAFNKAVIYYSWFIETPLLTIRHSRFPCILLIEAGMSILCHLLNCLIPCVRIVHSVLRLLMDGRTDSCGTSDADI